MTPVTYKIGPMMECVRCMVSICYLAWRQPLVLACVTVSGLIPLSGSGKEGQKGHCWAPGEDKDNGSEAWVLKRTMAAGLWGSMC